MIIFRLNIAIEPLDTRHGTNGHFEISPEGDEVLETGAEGDLPEELVNCTRIGAS